MRHAILLPPALAPAQCLAPLAAHLEALGIHCDAVDLLGQGLQGGAPDLGAAAQARALAGRGPGAAVIGLGFGATVAVQCALDWPTPPPALVLMGAGLAPLPPQVAADRTAWFGTGARTRALSLQAAARAIPDRQAPRLIAAQAAGLSGSARLADLTLPVLILHGGRDRVRSLADAQALAEPLEARVEVIAEAGHAVALDQPGIVAERIARFLTATRTPVGAPTPAGWR